MSEPQIMYRAYFNFGSLSMWHPESPASAFCSSMHLSSCGQFVELQRRRLDQQGWDTIRESMSQYWQPTKEKALAVVAPRLRQIGERLIRQADELEQAAREQETAGHAIAQQRPQSPAALVAKPLVASNDGSRSPDSSPGDATAGPA